MRPLLVTSPHNPAVARWRRLVGSAGAVRREGLSLAEGIHLARQAAHAGVAFRSVILRSGPGSEELAALLDEDAFRRSSAEARCYLLPPALYAQICPVSNGVGLTVELTTVRPPRPERPLGEDAVYLDGVQDAGNVGSVLRTAWAAGIRQVAAGPGCAALWSAKVLRAAMGAHFSLCLRERVGAEEIPALFAGTCLAAAAHGGEDLFAAAGWADGPTVWLFGSEGQGLSAAALALARRRLTVPLGADCESLNVAACAAVCLFEQARRRGPRAAPSP